MVRLAVAVNKRAEDTVSSRWCGAAGGRNLYVETGNTAAGTWCFRAGPSAPVTAVPFLPARALVHLDAAWRVGPATLIGRVENLLNTRYAATIEPKESFGQFYEAGPPASVSLGVRLAARAKGATR